MPDIAEIQVGLLDPSPFQRRRRFKNIDKLADSIKDVGLIEPIIVRPMNGRWELIAGERRWRAARYAEIQSLLAIVRDVDDSTARRMSLAENIEREDLTRIEEIDGWILHTDAELWPDEEYRNLAEVNGYPDSLDDEQARLRVRWLLSKLNADYVHDTDHFVHKFMYKIEAIFSQHPRKVDWRSFLNNDVPLLDLPKLVLDMAVDKNLNKAQTKALGKIIKEGSKEAQEVLKTGEVIVRGEAGYEKVAIEDASSREIARSPVRSRLLMLEEEAQQTLDNVLSIDLSGKYRAIVIDPPWPVQKILRDVRPNQDTFDYPTMTIEKIANLPITDLADENGCHVYLWVTHKYLPDGLWLFEQWGVKYECIMTWIKNVGFTPFSWMYSTEHVLFGRIGSLEVRKKGLRLDFQAKVEGHSKKPDVFYELVRQASSEPRIELFAREQKEGFEVWGNEV